LLLLLLWRDMHLYALRGHVVDFDLAVGRVVDGDRDRRTRGLGVCVLILLIRMMGLIWMLDLIWILHLMWILNLIRMLRLSLHLMWLTLIQMLIPRLPRMLPLHLNLSLHPHHLSTLHPRDLSHSLRSHPLPHPHGSRHPLHILDLLSLSALLNLSLLPRMRLVSLMWTLHSRGGDLFPGGNHHHSVYALHVLHLLLLLLLEMLVLEGLLLNLKLLLLLRE
jgi:hypothetical protein